MKQKEKEKLLRLAESSALLAGTSLKNRHEEWHSLKTASKHDVKIRADRESEEIIAERLAESAFPVFSEEAGTMVARRGEKMITGTDYLWIIDPLDGSLNYHQGIPLACVSIALYKDKLPIIGVVFDFNHGELFSGLIGSGAWLNHRPIRPSGVDEISKAVLGTGFPVNTDFSKPVLSRFISEVQHFRKVRLLGSAALSLCYVACGRVDAYREDNIMFWDVAAGCALIQAAGGLVRMKNLVQPDKPVTVVATNGRIKMDGMGNSKRKGLT